MAPARSIKVPKYGRYRATTSQDPPVMDMSTIGLDLAKTVFLVRGVDASDAIVVRKTMRRLMPQASVKPNVERGNVSP